MIVAPVLFNTKIMDQVKEVNGIPVFKIGKPVKDNGMGLSTRYITPPPCREIHERFVKYKYAQDLIKDLEVKKNCRHFAIINGTFIAGDLVEAMITHYNWHVKRLCLTTLSLNQGNVDSIANLIHGNFVDRVDLITSDHFFANNRHATGLVPYIYRELDTDKAEFQYAVARTHCKITTIETHCGLNIVIHGSANLTSSDNIEQIVIEESRQLLEFNVEVLDQILEKYKTIKKAVRPFKEQ